MTKHLALKDFDKSVAVNVDDMKDTEKIRQWCTMLDNRTHCAATCRDFGDRMCDKALKYDHDDYCKRGEAQCKCCCQPVCRGAPNKVSMVDMQGEKEEGGSTTTVDMKGQANQSFIRRAIEEFYLNFRSNDFWPE